MTDKNEVSKDKLHHIRNWPDIEQAIIQGDEQRLKALLSDELVDHVQKHYLVKIAEEHEQPAIAKLAQGRSS